MSNFAHMSDSGVYSTIWRWPSPNWVYTIKSITDAQELNQGQQTHPSPAQVLTRFSNNQRYNVDLQEVLAAELFW